MNLPLCSTIISNMVNKIWARLRRISLRRYGIGLLCVIVLSGVFAGWQLYERSRLYSRIDTGATLVTADLLSSTLKLRDGFGLTTDAYHSKDHTRDYLAVLRKIEKDCASIHSYKTKSENEGSADALRQYLAKSDEICAELSKLAKDSITLTETVRPLLEVNATAKFYQTLPFVTDSVRSSHEAKITKSLDELPDKTRFIEHPSQTKLYLQQLRDSLEANSGLSYFPALAAFQMDIYGERQRYWNVDGELGNLIRAFEIYLDRYCGILPKQDADLSVCKES